MSDYWVGCLRTGYNLRPAPAGKGLNIHVYDIMFLKAEYLS